MLNRVLLVRLVQTPGTRTRQRQRENVRACVEWWMCRSIGARGRRRETYCSQTVCFDMVRPRQCWSGPLQAARSIWSRKEGNVKGADRKGEKKQLNQNKKIDSYLQGRHFWPTSGGAVISAGV